VSSSTGIKIEKRALWQFPWKYKESFLIALELLIVGFIIEVLNRGRGTELIQWPVNLIVLLVFVTLLSVTYFLFKKTPVVKWLSSVPASVSAISLLALLVLLLGFIPQDSPHPSGILHILGLTHVKTSWPLLIAEIYFLITLGFVAFRRALPLTTKNIGFLLNHTGLWIIIVAATLGAGDLKRLSVNLYENKEFNQYAFDEQRKVYQLPVSMKLLDFTIDEYNAKLAVANASTGKIIHEDGSGLVLIEDSLRTQLAGWKIGVVDYLPVSWPENKTFVQKDTIGATPAALVVAINPVTKDTVAGWIASGSFRLDPKYIALGSDKLLFLTKPEPRKFSSKILIRSKDNQIDTARIFVNKPITKAGWKFYQMSYDTQQGRWSSLSVIEAVRDPWLPLVYIGIIMMLAGAIYIFWIGREGNEEPMKKSQGEV
jgi:hypothetical protein